MVAEARGTAGLAAGSCPPPSELWDLVSEELDPSAKSGLCAHVAGCARCQAVLEEASDDAELSAWASGVKVHRPRVDYPELPALLQSLSERWQWRLATIGDRVPTADDDSFGFLGPAVRPGDIGQIDGYFVESQIGRGGMGIVLLAFDPSLQRKVALKVMRPALADERARERFVREARAAARVKHDHVVSVYSVDTLSTGLPYCVLEYIDGMSLEDLIRQEGPLAPRAAADIATQVASGLSAAHAAGLVHRDIKPSNILLERDTQRAKIVDFGLARAVEASTAQTQAGFLAGTPAYMSPEQAVPGGRVGPESDIFSLGVTLYHALTGVLPFQGAPHIVLDRIVHDDPHPPRQLNDAIPRDLETICLKCLHKEPERRYATAVELAADLGRFLRGEPVLARPESVWEMWGRRARRRPAVFALGSLLAVALVVLAAGWAAYTIRLRAANARADLNFERAFQAVDHMLSRVGGQDLADVPEMEKVRHDLLAEALEFLRAFVAEQTHSDDPKVLRGLAIAHQRMGSIQFLLGDQRPAEQEYRRAIAIQAHLFARFPNEVKYRQELAVCRLEHARVLSAQFLRAEAESELKAARTLFEPLIAHDPAAARGAAGVASELGAQYVEVRRVADAERECRTAIKILETSGGDPRAVRGHLADVLRRLGVICWESGRSAEAEAVLLRSYGLWQSLARDEVSSRAVRNSMAECGRSLAVVYSFTSRPEKALPFLQSALEFQERQYKDFPRSADAAESLALTHHGFGTMYQHSSQPDLAQASYRRAIEIREALATAHPDTPQHRQALIGSYQNLALACHQSGRLAEAESFYDSALKFVATFERDYPAESQFPYLHSLILTNLGNLLREQGRADNAAARLDEAIAIADRWVARYPNSPTLRDALYKAHGARAQTSESAGHFGDAASHWLRVIDLEQDASLRVRNLLGRCLALARAGDYQTAAAESQPLLALEKPAGDELYNIACLNALLVTAADDDSRLTSEERTSLHARFTATAIGSLESACAAGYFSAPTNYELLEKDPDLGTLRELAQFRRLHEHALKSRPSPSSSVK
jgi:tetratricopeptide (TPR) repeat protein